LKLEIERQEVLVRFRKNQRLPQLDLNVSYGTSGIEGKGNPDAFNPDANADPPPDTGGNFSDTHDQWFEKRGGREYAVGGVISIPLGNYGPRHSVSKARLELRRAKTQMLALNQNIILEVRRDIRLFEAARKGIDASERQRIAAEEQLRAERIRLKHGETTPFDVLQKESDLVNAEVSKIRALQLYRTSAANLARRQGTILRTHNIVVGSVSALRNGMESESFGLRDILDPINPASRN
jgi:outer membrane protein TolC